jgi:acylpyruvate hydrolase
MKIICIGQNYSAHIKELNSAIPDELVFFLKPETALLQNNHPFSLPSFSNDIHHEIEIVLKINKTGKNITENEASHYYDALTVGIDFTARDIQKILKTKGLPWEKAKAFDQSAVIGQWVSKEKYTSMNQLHFHLDINGKTVQQGVTNDLLFSFEKIIAYLSTFMTLNAEDIIFTGTPMGVGSVKVGDTLEGYLENQRLLAFNIIA